MGNRVNYRIRRLFIDRPNPTFVPKPWHVIINWGNSDVGRTNLGSDRVSGINRWVNSCDSVRLASNKLSTFRALENKDGVRIPTFTTDRAVAAGWIRDGVVSVCRTQLSGHSGAGIVLADTEDKLVNAPLYVQYVKKQKEFRVHVCFGEVIDVQEKRKRKDVPDDFNTDFQVRNHHTGWVYCREDITEPEGMREMAVKTVACLGLDFGAVDIIWNQKRNECYVLECNTAPGLEGSTVDKYASAFLKELVK